MTEALPIQIPQEYVNDDTVKLLRWHVADGQVVQEGLMIAEIETSKAVVELTAAAAGTLVRHKEAGEELRIGEIIGYISENGNVDTPNAQNDTLLQREVKTEPGGNIPAGTRFSKNAMELIRRNGIAPSIFARRDFVREQDVADYIQREKTKLSPLSAVHFALEGIPLDEISFPAVWDDTSKGKVEADFLAILRKNPGEFARLSSAEKCEAYRNHGALVGNGVTLGQNSVVIAPQIVLGAQVQIGANSFIQCRERFVVGQLTSFRTNLSVRGGTVAIGENVFGGSGVQIGGGGHDDPYSLLCLGDSCYIGDDVFINICRPVLVGKEVFLTQRSILVTHNIGHSVLDGYENRFAPIILENYSQVGMNSTIYAGTRIGKGSIVMSNSYVVSPIPPGKLAAGVPARVIREAQRPLNRKRQIEIVATMICEYRELLFRKGYEVSDAIGHATAGFELQDHGKRYHLRFVENYTSFAETAIAEVADESVIWTFESSVRELPPSCAVMDLLMKKIYGSSGIFVDTTREFLRKRGIRLEPGPWRYAGGLI